MEIRVSVRNLVEFIMRSGDIDNRKKSASPDAMLEGGRIHRMIQRRMGSNYNAEVPLFYRYDTPDYTILIDGRADGIIDGVEDFPDEIRQNQLMTRTSVSGITTIDEIKGVYKDLNQIKEAVPVHVAQAKVYAYIYATQYELMDIRVRMTYCNMETEEIKYFHFDYTRQELTEWFEELMASYKKWTDFQFEWNQKKIASIKNMPFPYQYRTGQRELIVNVYNTIYHQKKLYLEAPTGVGKTLATIYPSVMAMGEGHAQRIFYLTAKTITRTVAEESLSLMRGKGLCAKSVTLTAKDKICFQEESNCNPEACPYAKGHLDRVNDAMYDLLTHADNFDRDTILAYAEKYQVCPFEFSLDMSLFSDVIIGDYNYLFDPHVYLKRFFAEGRKEPFIFLIDEAHNLVERGREMYSAELVKEDVTMLRRELKDQAPKLKNALAKVNRELLALKKQCEEYVILDDITPLIISVNRLYSQVEKFLEDEDDSPVRDKVLDFYFKLAHFTLIYDLLDENYVMYSKMKADGTFGVRLYCVNPRNNLMQCMDKGRSSILFSATMLPIQYHKYLLGGQPSDYEVYARSVFEQEKLGLFIAEDVTSKYSRRTEGEYIRIANYIHEMVSARTGNYMVFFPSHAFLQKVFEIYMDDFFDEEEQECICQGEYMNEASREQFLSRFQAGGDNDFSTIQMEIEVEKPKSLIGFCVLGGIFGEGIDLKKDLLIGAAIVGTGLPQVCDEREIIKDYFSDMEYPGFDYAYRFPGMNKVLQAAGRVIRTVEDTGVVLLLDERFLYGGYKQLFPREWSHYKKVSIQSAKSAIKSFWNSQSGISYPPQNGE